jgi:hypothetical protein
MLVNADFVHANRLWNEQLREDASSSATAALLTMPFQAMNPMSDQYPLTHIGAVTEILGRLRGDTSALLFKIAMAQMEMGDVAASTGSFQKLLEANPRTPMLPLIKFYLKNLTNQEIDVTAKSTPPIIEEFDMIWEDAPAKPNSPVRDKAAQDEKKP